MKLMTIKEAGKFLECSTTTIYRLCKKGQLPYIKKSFGIRFKEEDLKDWIEKDIRKIDLTSPFQIPIFGMEKGKTTMPKGKSKSRLNLGYGAIYVRKTKKGIPRYYIEYYDSEGKRRQELNKNATTWEEALAALKNAVRKEFLKAQGIKEDRKPVSFKEYSDLFLKTYSMPNKKSWKCDYYALEAHLKPFFGRFTLDEINPLLIEKFRSEKLKAGLKRSSTNRLLALLKKMFSVAKTWNFVDDNPVKEVKLFSEKDNKKERVLTEQEETQLLEESADHLKPIIITALNAGMRKGEILNLTWSQVDLKQRLIKVVKTKSGKDREIPINDVLFEVLKELKNSNRSDYVFTNPKSGKPFKSVQHGFENACRRANIKNLRFHDIRHSFSCRLIQKGCDIETLRSLLGHHSITVTERYIHTDRDQKRRAIDLTNESKKAVSLLRIRYMKKESQEEKRITPLFSVN